MNHADRIRIHGRDRYVLPARKRGEQRFSIRAGDVVADLDLTGRAPAVCSALKTRQFLKDNQLRIVEVSGPRSGQSTTVRYTYEFIGDRSSVLPGGDAWDRLRGAFKDIFKELGGGEAYLRSERNSFYGPEEGK